MVLQKKYCIFGIIGCLCFGIGDWLLGYVDPGLVEGEVFYFIRVGHGLSYSASNIAVVLALAAFGMCLLYPGFVRISDIAKDKKTKQFLRYVFGLCSMGWLMLHIMVSVNVLVFSEAEKNGGRELAVVLSNRFGSAGLAVVCCAYFFVAVAFIVLIVDILRGNTYLKKSAVLFSPAVWMAVIAAVSLVLPQSAFSYGLYTFCMNGGMLVWFAYLLTKRNQIEMKQI